jgi:multidrug transporter EmrE-like cation transporter
MDIKKLIMTWGIALISALLNAYGTLIIKYALNQLGDSKFDNFSMGLDYAMNFLKSPLALSGVLALIISAVLMIVSYSQMDVTIAFPAIMGLNFMLIGIFGFLLLNETFSIYKIIGILLVMISIVCFTR